MKHVKMPPSIANLMASGARLHIKEDGLELLTRSVETLATAADTRLKKAESESATLSTRLTDVEQKLGRRGGAGTEPREARSWGCQVAESQDLDTYVKSGAKGRVRIEIKNVNTITGTAGGLGAGLIAPDIQQPNTMPKRPLRLRDLLIAGTTTSNTVSIPKQTGRQLNAGTVAEGTLKPQSDVTFALVNWPVATIAHWILASKQALADAPVLSSMIDSELLYGLADIEDHQILSGDGTGTNLLGLIPQATAFALPAGFGALAAGHTQADVLRVALLQARLALFPPTGIVLHPTDWALIQLLKDAQGKYLFPPTAQPSMWGLPVIETEGVPAGHFLVGAFGTAAQLFDREEAAVFVSTEDSDNFRRNLVTVLGEERVALAVPRPDALVYGALIQA